LSNGLWEEIKNLDLIMWRWIMLEIKKIDIIDQDCVNVIRDSFITVANDFNITRENAPTNAAFIEMKNLEAMKQKGVDMYGAYIDESLIGFVAIEKSNEDLYFMEKLAVLPLYRHNGYGSRLIDFVVETVKEAGGKKISIGIINENNVLKDWYMKNGFSETGIKKFPHLPFSVCFLERTV